MEYSLKALEIDEEIGNMEEMAWTLKDIAAIYKLQNDYSKALVYNLKALKIAEKSGNKSCIANTTGEIGVTYDQLGDNIKSLEYFFKALKISEKSGTKTDIAVYNRNIGLAYMKLKNYPRSLLYYSDALKIDEEIGDKQTTISVLTNIGTVYDLQKDYPKGLGYKLKALKIAEETGNQNYIAGAMTEIGVLYQHKGDYPKSLQYFLNALKMSETCGVKSDIALYNKNIAVVYKLQNDYNNALKYFFKAMGLDEQAGNKIGIITDNIDIAYLYQAQNNYPKALEFFFRSLKEAEESNEKKWIASNTKSIGFIYYFMADYSKALEYLFKALKMNEDLEDTQQIAYNNWDIGLVYDYKKDYPTSLAYLFKSLKTFEDMKDKEGIVNNTTAIGDVYIKQKNYGLAITYIQRSLDLAKETGQKNTMGTNLGNLGEVYLYIAKDSSIKTKITGKTALLHKAIYYLQSSIDTFKRINSLGGDGMQEFYQNLSEAYKLTGNYKQALECADNYRAIKDSIFSAENDKKMMKIGMDYEYNRKRASDSLKADGKEKIAHIQLQKQRTYTYMGVAGIFVLAGFSFFIARERKKSELERKKSDTLLLNILPAEVADELKLNGSTKARHFDDVTVFFTDFVNFTQASERLSPQGLIDELHTCFKAFDEITGKYNIEKIKTIGDAYLAVCGLPLADPKHAENIVRAAIEINAFMQARLAKMGSDTFDIRIGIHSGSVVAGIVGVKKFAYDIWGDTVNTAARMEQHSEPGRINISQTTYEMVKDKFACAYRGEIMAKNKGGMRMYYVSPFPAA